MAGFLTVAAPRTEVRKQNGTTIEVSNFGGIAEGSVKLAPLTILVGKNNSGKSYMASLLWAVHNFSSEISFGKGRNGIKAPKWFREGVQDCKKGRSKSAFKVTGAQVSRHINTWLRSHKKSIISRLLSFEEADISRFLIKTSEDIYIHGRSKAPAAFSNLTEMGDAFSWAVSFDEQDDKNDDEGKYIFASGRYSESEAQDELYKYVISCLIHSSTISRNATYIPASRSGLVLSLEYIASSLFQELGIVREQQYNSRFSRPVISFLRSLVNRPGGRNARNKHAEIVQFMEKSILNGAIEREDGAFPSFYYVPSNSGNRLPMHAVSSMVTEIAPVVDRLRGGYGVGALIFEEPEAHLHLSAQREMARAIVRIVNSGTAVVLTTHSDTFVQEINFLIQISSSKDKNKIFEKYGYTEEDVISNEDVVAYEFKMQETGTVISQSRSSKSGFAVESLNEVLLEISKQAFDLEDD